jgi:thiol-disulfide isomerase/thioredoxin
MRNAARWLAVALAAAGWSAACLAVEEGAPAPELKAQLLDGARVSLKDFAGKVVVINFWATWCQPCMAELPALDAYYRRHRDEGLVLLMINMDEPSDEAKVRRFVAPYTFPVALLGKTAAEGYGRIWHTPLTFVVDRRGVLRKDGWTMDPHLDQAALEKIVTPLLRAD